MTDRSPETIEAALARLARLHPKKIDLLLDRIGRLLDALGRPQDRLPPVIHIAGTNGKGSTAAFLKAMFEAQGERVHVYTSPHLVRFNERITLAGEAVDDAGLIDAFHRCEAANDGQAITFFEITTAAAFLLFSETPADRLILETGLGGRVDATNVLSAPQVTVITPVSLDHREFLGDTVAAIAAEKAGIVKRGRPLVIGPQHDEALDAILARARAFAAPVHLWGQDFRAYPEHGRLVYEEEGLLWDLPAPGLVGSHQTANAAVAIKAALADCRIPKVTAVAGPNHGDPTELELDDDPAECWRLDVSGVPLVSTVARVGKNHVVDATRDESSIAEAETAVAVDVRGNIRGVTTVSSRGGFDVSALRAMIKIARDAARDAHAATDAFLLATAEVAGDNDDASEEEETFH